MRKIWKIGKGLFCVAVLSALSMGATQALSGTPVASAPALTCDATQCYRQCIQNGIRSGYCRDGKCVCGLP